MCGPTRRKPQRAISTRVMGAIVLGLVGMAGAGCSKSWIRPPGDWLASRTVREADSRDQSGTGLPLGQAPKAAVSPPPTDKPDPSAGVQIASQSGMPMRAVGDMTTFQAGDPAAPVTANAPVSDDPRALARQVAAELYGESASSPQPPPTQTATSASPIPGSGGSPYADPFGDQNRTAVLPPIAQTSATNVRYSLSDRSERGTDTPSHMATTNSGMAGAVMAGTGALPGDAATSPAAWPSAPNSVIPPATPSSQAVETVTWADLGRGGPSSDPSLTRPGRSGRNGQLDATNPSAESQQAFGTQIGSLDVSSSMAVMPVRQASSAPPIASGMRYPPGSPPGPSSVGPYASAAPASDRLGTSGGLPVVSAYGNDSGTRYPTQATASPPTEAGSGILKSAGAPVSSFGGGSGPTVATSREQPPTTRPAPVYSAALESLLASPMAPSQAPPTTTHNSSWPPSPVPVENNAAPPRYQPFSTDAFLSRP